MARPLRIEYPGAVYHVVCRGNERRAIVRDDGDREKRLDWLRRTVETYGWLVHAFVLMTNHEHLFVQTPQPNLSAGMQYLNGSYTGYFNRRHRRVGHLFQGRFKGHLVEEEGYFLEISRYLHLNPVRAQMVGRPEEYRWSSYAGYVGARGTLPWVTYDHVLGEFGRDVSAARRAYVRFVEAGIEASPPSPFREAIGGLLLGSEKFVARIQGLLGAGASDAELPSRKRLRSRPSLEQILEAVARHLGHDPASWSSGHRSDDASRAAAAYVARRRFGYSAKAVAAALGYRDASGVSHAIRRIEAGTDDVRKVVSRIEGSLGW